MHGIDQGNWNNQGATRFTLQNGLHDGVISLISAPRALTGLPRLVGQM